MITIQNLFTDNNIISAVIDRALQMGLDTIYWKQYMDFQRTTQRIIKAYLGTVTGVMAGSINSRYGEKPIQERRNLGYGYGEVAYLGDAFQISTDRLSELKDLLDKYNAAKPEDQTTIIQEIIDFIIDDFRQIMLMPHKRMDLIVGSLLMTGSATVKNKDDRKDNQAADLLQMDIPLNIIKPSSADVIVDSKKVYISYLQDLMEKLKPKYGVYQKMIMTRATFNKFIIGSSEFGDKFKQTLGDNQMYLSSGLISSQVASQIFQGIGLPAIEIKSDYVEEQDGTNQPVYADNRICLLPQDKIGKMRYHEPYEKSDPVDGHTYSGTGNANDNGDMLVANYHDKSGRYMEYTAEWIPQFTAPNKITNINLEDLA